MEETRVECVLSLCPFSETQLTGAKDFFASPGDPVFFLHHAAIDRLYWTWQNQAPASRKYVVDGPTVMGDLSSRNTTLDDVVDITLGKLAKPKMIRELVDTLSGPFCYVYA